MKESKKKNMKIKRRIQKTNFNQGSCFFLVRTESILSQVDVFPGASNTYFLVHKWSHKYSNPSACFQCGLMQAHQN